jgi:hypothetical protein
MNRLLSLTLLLTTLCSCRDAAGVDDSALYGNYTLRTVGGAPLPIVNSNGSKILSGAIVLSSDHTWSSITYYQQPLPHAITYFNGDQGSWSRQNLTLTFSRGTSSWTGTFSNDTLVIGGMKYSR